MCRRLSVASLPRLTEWGPRQHAADPWAGLDLYQPATRGAIPKRCNWIGKTRIKRKIRCKGLGQHRVAPSRRLGHHRPWDRRHDQRERMMPGPLAGVRVIDVTIAVLGPVATQILGDMGAEVIKVETPDGDPMRQIGPARHPGMAAYFLNLNRNKKSLVLDLKRPAAQQAMLRLAATADVFVHNMRPGAATRLGIDYQAI